MDDDARRRRELASLYGSMERCSFSIPSPPYTLHASGAINTGSAFYPHHYALHSSDAINTASAFYPYGNHYPNLYPDEEARHGGRIEVVPTRSSRYPDATPSRYSAAPSRARQDMELIPAAPSRHRRGNDRIPAAGSRHGTGRRRNRIADPAASRRHGDLARRSMDSLHAGAAHHLGAAARYMEEVERRRRVRASEDSGDHDSELDLPSDVENGDVDNSGSDNGDGDCGLLGCDGDNNLLVLLSGLLFGMCTGGDVEANDVSKRLHELLYVVLALVPPYPLYKILPDDVVHGGAWTWFLILYGFLITIVTTLVSLRALSSRCCTSKCMRTLLFVTSVAVEILVYVHVIPNTKLDRGGTLFSLFHLVVFYVVEWTPWFRRRLRR